MTDHDGDADGEARGASQVCAFGVTGGEDGEDQLKGDEELHEQAVSHRDVAVHLNRGIPW